MSKRSRRDKRRAKIGKKEALLRKLERRKAREEEMARRVVVDLAIESPKAVFVVFQ